MSGAYGVHTDIEKPKSEQRIPSFHCGRTGFDAHTYTSKHTPRCKSESVRVAQRKSKVRRTNAHVFSILLIINRFSQSEWLFDQGRGGGVGLVVTDTALMLEPAVVVGVALVGGELHQRFGPVLAHEPRLVLVVSAPLRGWRTLDQRFLLLTLRRQATLRLQDFGVDFDPSWLLRRVKLQVYWLVHVAGVVVVARLGVELRA